MFVIKQIKLSIDNNSKRTAMIFIIDNLQGLTINQYRNFVLLILNKYKKKFYISKNNNNILRLESIISAFPNCLIIIPFRDPIQQANSLLTQHKNFTEIQKNDRFVKSICHI